MGSKGIEHTQKKGKSCYDSRPLDQEVMQSGQGAGKRVSKHHEKKHNDRNG
jgi:hypothetical protein